VCSFPHRAPAPLLRLLAALIFVCAVAPASAGATTWHVSPSGTNIAAGTAEQPFRWIRRAAAAARPGDTVLVASGRYPEEVRLTSAQDGVVFRGVGARRPVVDGVGRRAFGFASDGAEGVTIENFELKRQTVAGIAARGSSNVISGNLVHHVGQTGEVHANGIRVTYGRGNRVVGNTVHHVGPGREAMGIWLLETRDAVVDDNTVYLVRKEGIRDWHGLDNSLTRNRTFLNWIGLALNTSTGTVASDNLSYDNTVGISVKHASSVNALSLWGLLEGRMTRVVHNTVFRSGETSIWMAQSDAPLDHVDVRENRFAGAGTAFVRDAPALRGPDVMLDRNLYSNVGGRPAWLYKAGWSSAAGLLDWGAVTTATGWETNAPPADAGARGTAAANVTWTPRIMTPVSSSSEGTYYTRTHLDKTADNRQHTYWMTAGNRDEHVVFDLGSPQVFDHVIATVFSDLDLRNPRGYRFEVSDDGTTWTQVSAGVNPDHAGAANIYELTRPVRARYLRYTMVDTFCLTQLVGLVCGDSFVLSDVKVGRVSRPA
jgi:hypothetical protein